MSRILISVILFFSVSLSAQSYNFLLIPDSLKQHANAVKRFEELSIEIKSNSRAVVKHKYAITILNEAGDNFSEYDEYYDNLQSLSDISGHLYDAFGKEIKSLKSKDIIDASYNDEISLMTDNRIKRHNFYYKVYPYTIEYEDEKEYKGIFHLPSWRPVLNRNFSVQQSRFIVTVPSNYKLRYKQFNYLGEPLVNNSTYTWEVKNIKPIEFEAFQPPFSEITTSVYVAPSDFEIGKFSGNMETWQNLGKFIAQLNSGKDILPEKIKQDIHQLTDGITSKQKKIELLYDYVQKNTRYISIQLGIGGWQPFDASYVASKRYGDCKALSNYMVSVLKEAGINANYVLISAGEGKKGLWEDFPAPYFNHAIMCVPNGNDTTWLECTSQTESPGFMGSFTGDRKALLINENGGFVVTTPVYKASDNQEQRKTIATVDDAGNVTAEVFTKFTGIAQELEHSLIHDATNEQREKYLNRAFALPTYTVDKYEYKEEKGKIPVVYEYLKVAAPNYASVTGKRLFIQPNIFNKSETKLNTDKPRKFAIEYNSSFIESDTVLIAVPLGYSVESLPKDISLTNKFGKFKINFKVDGNKIEVVRLFQNEAATYPPSDFEELAKYMEDVYKADRSKIVFVKKE